ncbi:MAG: hypothetical protein U0871_29640 [Gemmataceae bacterium]
MLCPACQTEARRFGKDRDGNQRWQCRPCKKKFSERPARQLGPMRLELDKALPVLQLLVEGMSVRAAMRVTRLTNAFSKKWDNHRAALSLWFAYYNFCRPHQMLSKQAERPATPAMAAGIEDHPWTLRELVERSTLS